MIFPAPNPAPAPGTDVILLSRGEIFGQHVLPGRHPADLFFLDLEDLRNFAQERMTKKMGLTPAWTEDREAAHELNGLIVVYTSGPDTIVEH